MKPRLLFFPWLITTLALATGRMEAATYALDQIGDPSSYQSGLSVPPAASQIFDPAFAAYDSMAIDDFTVTESGLTVTSIAGLFLSQNGFDAFAGVEAYRVSIFSSVALAGISLHGDVADLLVLPDLGAVVTAVGAGGLGFVNIEVDVVLPAAGTYWVGISPVASSSGVGSFFLQNQGAPSPANSNGKFANPGLGYEQGAVFETVLDYAYQVTVVPEPSAAFLAVAGAALLLARRRPGKIPRRG